MNALTSDVKTDDVSATELLDELNIDELNETDLLKIHPQLADVIKTIQAEKLGDEALAWTDFSQHSKH